MKKLRRISLLLLLLLAPVVLHAQELSNAETRRMNKRLLDMIKAYESVATVYDEYTYYAMLQLCKDGEAVIYSDMLDYASGKMLKASEYVEQLSKKNNVSVKIKNVRKKSISKESDGWHLVAKFDKSISYTDNNGVLFSSSEFFNADYAITFECVYVPQDDICYINSIKGDISSATPHLTDKGFVVVNKGEDPKISKWKVNDRPLAFNSFDQALVPRGSLVPWNDDVHIVTDTLARGVNYEHINLGYRTTHWRAKARFAYAVGGVYKVNSATNLDLDRSSGYEVGIDLGYTIPMGKTSTVGLFVGAAMSSTKLQLGITTPISYSYRMTDSKNNEYQRNYNISSITEGVSYQDIVFPAYLNFEHKLVKNLFLSWHLGAKIYLNGQAKVDPFTVKGEVSAVSTNGAELATTEKDALGSLDGSYNAFMFPNHYNRALLDFSAVAGLNLMYNIYRRQIWVYADFSYEYGLAEIHSSDNNKLFSKEEGLYPIVYSAHQGRSLATRSFMDCVSYTRRTMWAELGFMFKF